MGAPLSELWAEAGHSVFVSSRHPERLIAPTGGSKGTIAEACAFADVILLATPFAATAEFPTEVKAAMAGKIVIDANNANHGGAAAEAQASGRGSGAWTAAQLP